MFEALKKKLGLGKKKKQEELSGAPAEPAAEDVFEETPVTAEPAASDDAAYALSAAPQKTASPASAAPASAAAPAEEPEEEDDGESSGGVLSKLKSLIVDHKVTLSDKAIDDALTDLQMVLLESDVAYPVTEAIVASMKEELSGSKKKMFSSSEKVVTDALKHAIESVLGTGFDLPAYINTHEKPVKILFTGVNGTGKTTSVAKIAAYLQSQGFSVVAGAGDTFRAGAIEQLRVHCDRLGVKLIAHQEGADPSAVLYDTVEYAKAHQTDVVLADSAGRFHNRANLMSQLDKIKRVMKPDLVFYVDEAVAGNDAVIRAEEFEKTVSTDGVILTKVDMDPKGGAAISIAYTIGKPLVFLGVGQEYTDMRPFTPSLIIDEIFGEEK